MKNNSITRMVKSVALLMVLMLLVTSCKSKVEKIMDALPADADIVVVGDVKNVVESAGGKVEGTEIKLPDEFNDLFTSREQDDMEESLDQIKKSGVNTEACAMIVNYNDNDPVYVVLIDDEKDFIKCIESADFEKDTEEDGVTYYEKKGEYCSSYLAIKGSIAYAVLDVWSDDFKPEKVFSKLIEGADEASFGDSGMGKYLKESNVGGVCVKMSKEIREMLEKEGVPSDATDMLKGYVCCRGDLKDNTANVSLKMFNEDGEEMTADDFKGKFNPEATINPKALKYIDKDEFLVYAVSMKDIDWDDYKDMLGNTHMSSDDQAILIAVKAYLEKIDGTVAMGVGVMNGFESFKTLERGRDIDKELAATMVFESKKAESMINDIKVLLDTYTFPYETISDGIKITIPGETMDDALTSWSIVSKDGFLVVSNREIKERENEMFEGMDFEKTNAIVMLNIPAKNQLMKDFSLKNDLKMVLASNVETMEVNLNCEFGDEPFLSGMLKAAKAIADSENHFLPGSYDDEEYAYDEDYELGDTLAYIEEAAVAEDYYE